MKRHRCGPGPDSRQAPRARRSGGVFVIRAALHKTAADRQAVASRIALDRRFDLTFQRVVAKDLRPPTGVGPDLPTMLGDGQPRVQLPTHLPWRDEGDVIDAHSAYLHGWVFSNKITKSLTVLRKPSLRS